MSKTDKTRPWWVDPDWWVPHHDIRCLHYPLHFRGEDCDLPEEPPRRYNRTPARRYTWLRKGGVPDATRCTWEPHLVGGYGYTLHRYRNGHKGVREQSNLMEGGIRAAWRAARQELLAVQREDLDDVELPDPRHRHFALWDRW